MYLYTHIHVLKEPRQVLVFFHFLSAN